ncbi:MAG TPA: hypothetical protein VIQ11_09400, partial [Mycobacterium sp.]
MGSPRLCIREAVNVLLDMSGELFTHNQFVARGEGRFGIGVLRPSSFAVVDLTAVMPVDGLTAAKGSDGKWRWCWRAT